MSDDEKWMSRALQLASQAELAGEVPVGAVIVFDGEEVATGYKHVTVLQEARKIWQ